MKTKFSKKLLSAFLAVLMVVSSVPVFSLTAFADDNAIDSAVAEVEEAMDAFETLLQSGGSYSNVTPAYEAYVACQEALDAYTYGGETDALDGVADALNTAVANIGEFTGVTGTAIPTFDTSSESDMVSYSSQSYTYTDDDGNTVEAQGDGSFGNILYSPSVGVTQASGTTASVTATSVYATDTVLLYDGVNDTKMPVMASAIVTGKYTRYLYSAYPSDSSGNDVDGISLVGYWQTGSGADANWNWNWWSGMYNGVTYHPAYNYYTGYNGNQSTSYRSAQLAYSTNWYGGFSSATIQYFANVLQVTEEPDGYYTTYTPYWYFGTGDNANSDAGIYETSNPIYVINYKKITDAVSTYGSAMKSIDPSNYSEGGLADYISAMDDATSFDPNDYFVSSNEWEQCVADMQTIVENLETAYAAITADSDDYSALRSAMSSAVRNTYSIGNDDSLYTDDSWADFAEAYEAAQAIMADVNDNGYTSTEAATAAETLTAAYAALVTTVEKVDTSALVALIDAFEAYDNIFTDESYSYVSDIIDQAKAAVWTAVEYYNVAAYAPDDSTDSEELVAEWVQTVTDALAALRISADTVILSTADGYVSLNDAIALKEIVDANVDEDGNTNYGNLSTFTSAYSTATTYLASLETTDFTDYDTQYAEYVSQVQALYDAYNSLYISVIKLENGTLASKSNSTYYGTSSIEMTGATNNIDKGWTFGFDYTNKAVILKTTHDGFTATFGQAAITYGNEVSGRNNNMLDSVTINAGDADTNFEINSNQSSTPTALSDDEKETYAGCLSYNGFTISNLAVSDVNDYYDYTNYPYYAMLEDGTLYTSKNPTSADEYTTILGVTNGTSSNLAVGGVHCRSTDGTLATITLTGDFSLTVDADESYETTLTSSTKPTSTTYTLNTNFGATSVWNANSSMSLAYCGYGFVNSKDSDQSISCEVTVVDMSYLTDLVNLCNSILEDEDMYTASTWNKLITQLTNAQATLNYTTMSATNLLSQLQTRYTNLLGAYNGLVKKTFTVEFDYKDADGADASTSFTATYGDTLNDYADTISAIELPSYVENYYTYTFTGWDVELDYDASITSAATYTAQYTSTLNGADFTAYNTAVNNLLTALTDETYTVDDLEALASELSALTYFTYDSDAQIATMADEQEDIDTETETLVALLEALTPAEIDASTAAAALEEYKESSVDSDRYDLTGFEVDEYTQEVTVCENTIVVGLIFGTQEDIDAYVAEILNNLQVMTYTIYLNGEEVAADVPYGTAVIVDSDGNYYLDVDDTTVNADIDTAVWTYSYDAPSREDLGATTPKYMVTAPSFGFVVRGTTYLTADIQDSETADTYIVTVKSTTGNTIDVAVTTGEYTMPTAPNYAFYTFSSYSNGASAGDVITVTEDTTITAEYEADASNSYVITTAGSLDELVEGNVTTASYAYNDKVTVTPTNADDVYCWVVAECNEYRCDSGDASEVTFKVISAETGEYSFYACESFELTDTTKITGYAICPLSYTEYCDYVWATTAIESDSSIYYIVKTVYDSSSLTFYENTESTEKIVDANGNAILMVAAYCTKAGSGSSSWSYNKTYSSTYFPDLNPTVTSLTSAVPIYNGSTVQKFSLVGTFLVPDGCSIVECGFLFTSDTSVSDLTLQKVGTNGISRMKSSLYTCGNQFVVNITNPSSEVSFNYVAYAIIKDADGNYVEYYAPLCTGSNVF